MDQFCDFFTPFQKDAIKGSEVYTMSSSVYLNVSLQKKTALMKARSGGHVECVKILMDKGAKDDLQDEVSAVS